MAMNWQVFRTRALTALIFVLVMLGGLLWNRWSFFVLFSVIHWGCWLEYQRLIKRIIPGYSQISAFHSYGVILAGWSVMFFFAGSSYHWGDISFHAIGLAACLIFAFALPLMEVLFSKYAGLANIKYSTLGLIYISLSWALLINLRSMEEIRQMDNGVLKGGGWLLPVIIIVSLWINDTMAYITGSFIGKTPFTKISPKKTIEGTIGGIVLCVSVMGLSAYWLQLPVLHVCMIAGIAGIVGTAGDLLESKIKRLASVKDSGAIMPGHGGFLDRFDSLLLTVPAVWMYVVLFMK
ncbi:MAG: phosphatidate cytidylyltransferase [Chitinophagaceae bacterium]|nr:phosphatidate cytidylyltransferase [Chitinophagaceae bacterium]